MSDDIRAAINVLDPEDDNAWTESGLPAIDAIAKQLGKPVTRKEITESNPHARRTPPEVDAPVGQPDTPYDVLRAEEQGLRDEMAEFDVQIGKLRVQQKEVSDRRDAIVLRLESDRPDPNLAQQLHIKAQKEARAERNAKIRAAQAQFMQTMPSQSSLDAALGNRKKEVRRAPRKR